MGFDPTAKEVRYLVITPEPMRFDPNPQPLTPNP